MKKKPTDKAIAAARQMGFTPRESTTNEFQRVRIEFK
jgi:hypothetical protein